MNVLRRYIFQINIVDTGTVLHVQGHAGHCRNVINGLQSLCLTLQIHFLHPLYHLKQSGPSRDSVNLQRRGNRKTDGFLRSGRIRHHQVGPQRIKSPLHTLHGGIKGFQIDTDIGFVHVASFPGDSVSSGFIISDTNVHEMNSIINSISDFPNYRKEKKKESPQK